MSRTVVWGVWELALEVNLESPLPLFILLYLRICHRAISF